MFTDNNTNVEIDTEIDTLLESVIINYANPFEKVAEKFKQKREEAKKRKYKQIEETIIENVNLVLTYNPKYWDAMFNSYRTFLLKYKNGFYDGKVVPFASYGPIFYFPINYKYATVIARDFWNTPMNNFDDHQQKILDTIPVIEEFIDKLFNLEVLYTTILAGKSAEEIESDTFLRRIQDFCEDYYSIYKSTYNSQSKYASDLLRAYERGNKQYGGN